MDSSSPSKNHKKFSRKTESISNDLPDLVTVKTKSTFKPSTTDLDARDNVNLVQHQSSTKSIPSRASFISQEKVQQGSFNFYNQLEEMLIQKVLNIEPQNRYDEETLFTEKVFRNLPFFKELEPQMDHESFNKLFRKLRLVTYNPNEKICSDDSSESHVHIILSGRVEAQTLEYIAPSSRILKRSTSPRKLFFKDGETHTKQLSKGDAFGGLLSEKPEEKRKVTIYISQAETICAIIKYKDYLNIAGKSRKYIGKFYFFQGEAYAKKHSVNISFLSGLRIFQHWNHHRVTAFIRNTEEIRFNRNQFIFKEADQGDLFYFIKDGEVELQKLVEFENKDRDESFNESLPVLKIGKISSTINKPKTIKKSIRLGIITKADYFGESEFNETKPREYTVIAYSSEVTLLSIEKEKFKALMNDKVTMDIFKEQLLKKKRWREGLLSKLITVRNSVVETNVNSSISLLLNSPKYKQQDDQSPKDHLASFFSFSNFGKKFDDPETSSIGSPDEILAIKSPQYSDKPRGKSTKAMETILKGSKVPSTPFLNFSVVKNKKIQTSSRGLAFLRMNKSSDDTNPLYERQIARLEKKLNRDKQQKVESILLPGSKELDQSSKESPQFLGRKPDTPFIHLQGKSQSQGNLVRFSKSRNPLPPAKSEFSPSPSQSPKMADTSDHGKAMIKLMKSLGLNRLYGGAGESQSPLSSAFDIRTPSSPTFSSMASMAKERVSFAETGGIFRNSVTSNRSFRLQEAMNPMIGIVSPKIIPRTATASAGKIRLSFKNK